MNLFTHIKLLLSKNEKFCKDNELFKNNVVEAALKVDTELIKLLLTDDKAKETFFCDIEGVMVFDKVKFQKFVSNKQFLADSYTAFKNKIGLTASGEFLTDAKEVVLDFPYKDCVLEGGQTKEDQKRKEIFCNETLAPDDIDRLFEPKAFTNWKKYDKDGEHEVTDISLEDNLIIKGNNLIALHSLKEVYRGKIKLIYIDPPYNTGEDGFNYNDSFNHSSWLTFMKNRLICAWELLSNDGLFVISLSDKEAHYCKVLADELFNKENFVADIIWNSTKSVTNTAVISDAHTHNLLYSKNINILKQNRTKFRLIADESKFSNPDNDIRGKWVADPFQVGGLRPNQLYKITNPNTGKEYIPNPGCSWKNEKKVFDELLKDNRIVFGKTGESGPQRKRFWSEAKDRGQVTTTLWKNLPTTTNGTQHLKKLFKEIVFKNPKPEGLIERIIQLSTEENDIILDYHLGSGTTASVAHKMGRKYIGIEQMNYIQEVAVERLKMVIEGEQGGISKSVDWKGGGSFLYTEIATSKYEYISSINNSKDSIQLLEIWENLKKDECISHKVSPAKFDKEVKDFKDLDLEQQKQFLLSVIDSNQLYINYSDIEDENHTLTDTEKNLTRKFYNRE